MIVTKTALKFRPSVYVLILIIVFGGVRAYQSMPLEAAPDVQIPLILVSTVYPGVAPSDIETLVTNPLERELKDLKNVKKMTGSSSESVSVIQIEFDSSVDMDDAYQKVRDRVDKAKVDLPKDAEEPVLTEINFSEFPIMLVNVFGDIGLVRLKQIAESIEQRIEAIEGVLDVEVTGGLEREIQVVLNPERLEYYKIGVGQVIGRIQEEHLNIPGGNLELGESKYLVRVSGEYKDVALMEQIVLKAPSGNPVRLGDVGRVLDGYKDRESISRVNRKECVSLRIQKRAGENVVRISDEVHALLDALKTNLPPGVELFVQQDDSKHIRDIVSDLENSVITGLILVLAVLFFFMGLRNAFFVAIAIPLSLLITTTCLSMMGVTLNMVVLFSLILALGMLVDNSIVVVENIYRHASDGMSRGRAAYVGTAEVAWPIIASTATTVVAFGPMLFWPDLMGEFMSYLPRTVITALLGSLFVGLVVNPVVAAGFLKGGPKLFGESGEVSNPLLKVYRATLGWSLDWPKLMMVLAVGALAGVVWLYTQFGAGVEFFPNTTPERAQIRVKAPRGTLLQKTDRMVREVEQLSSGEDNIKNAVTNVGFGGGQVVVGGGGGSSHRAVMDLEFKDRHERTHSTWDSIRSLREQLVHLPGAEYRIEVAKMGPPTGAAVDVQISGEDYGHLQLYAQQVKTALATVEGVVDIKDDYDSGFPEIRVDVDRERAKVRKVSTAAVGQALRTAITGTKAAVLRDGDEEHDIIVRYERAHRSSINDVLDLKVTGEDDVQIPVRDVARVRTTGGVGTINHVDRKRTIKISADVMGRSSSEVLVDVRKRLDADLKLAPGYSLHYAGESEEQDRAAEFLSRAFIIGVLLMAMILITQFNSVLRPTIILASIIMSMMGVLCGLIITGKKFGIIMTGMGVISLAGVVVNNAIVLIDYINQLREKHGMGLVEGVLQAGLVRFRPVVMTAITTILGMLPMALGVNIDFRSWRIDVGSNSTEWWGPMARAVIFGLLFATLMTLVMVPVMYVLQVRFTEFWQRVLDRIGRRTQPRGQA